MHHAYDPRRGVLYQNQQGGGEEQNSDNDLTLVEKYEILTRLPHTYSPGTYAWSSTDFHGNKAQELSVHVNGLQCSHLLLSANV